MVNRPRWLSTATLAVIFTVIVVACTPAAAPTGSPTNAPTGTPAATTPGTSGSPGATPTGSGSPGASESPTPTPGPTGTAYPSALVQPTAPDTITDTFPNYGGPIDCAAGAWNGLPYTGNLQSLTAPDDHTVVFTFCNPDVAFLSKIAFSVFAVNDSEWLIAHTADGTQISTMNGTGALKFDTWTRGSEIDYSRYDDYWGDKSAPATAVLRWSAESAARLQELGAGTIDGMTLVGPTDFPTVEGNPDLKLQPAAGLNTLYLGMNHNFAPWDNPEVRKAIAIGLNRQQIVENFMPPGSEVADYFTPCAIPFACTGDKWPASDITAAKAKITEIFGDAGLTTTLAYRPPARGYLPLPAETAAEVQAQLEAINIHATLDEQQSATYIANSNLGKLEGLFLLGWGADYPDVTNFLDYHFGSGCTLAFGDCYPDIFNPLTTGGQTAVEADRQAAYTEANNAIRDEVPMVPISHAGFANAYLADVGNQEISPLGNELLYKMTPSASHGDQLVFMQSGEPGSLYCADESDGEALRACMQTMESLYQFQDNGTEPEPALATECSPSTDLKVWTCTLRDGVKFHDGSTFEAKDVLVSLAAQWDNLSTLHKGKTGSFSYWPGLWGGFLNPPPPCGISGQPACEE
jgi:ABC-type transport system substrate-binding protein